MKAPTLDAGFHLGPYEILQLIGSGGMGEVYRARDNRLQRDVAVKVLPKTLLQDPECLLRFEQEARATGQLNHPNIVAVHDFGAYEGLPYIVTELLEGKTLRETLNEAKLALPRIIEYSSQITEALAAAHDRGIIHRDLKPENIFILHRERVKVLDFGLAKILPLADMSKLEPPLTASGIMLGTTGYMSPEQVRGEPADQRSDIFAFGTILYEMLGGKAPFVRETAIQTLHAILQEDAPPIAGEYPETALQILWRCLQKAPEDRFQSAKDLSFSLRQILLSEGTRSIPGIKKPRVRIYSYLLAASVLLFLFAGFTYWKAVAKKDPHPSYQRLTFRRGAIRSARFGPDGQTIFYGASWDGKPYQIFSTRSQSPESVTERPGFADILAISKKGEIAAGLQYRYETGWRGSSTLAKGSISGGSLRELLENVQDADWSPNGELAVVRYIRWDQCVLESPAGRVVYTPTGWVSHIRFSPDGGAIAFLDHPLPAHDSGTVCVIEKSGKKRILTESWSSVLGLAWHPQTNEIWFTAARAGFSRSLYAVNLSGEIRLIAGIPGPLTLHDISSNGKVLLSHDNSRRGILGLFPGNSAELDISWLDWSILRAISEDGTLILFDEQADGAGETQNDIYVRKTDGAPAVCLAESMASLQLTPDAKWVLATNLGRNKLLLLPVGAGSPIALPISGIESILWSPLTNNLKTILVTARKPTEGYRIFKIDEKGTTKPVSSEGIRYSFALSPDQTRIATSNMDGQIVMTDLSSQESRILPIAAEHLRPISWSKDGNFLFFDKTGELPTKIYRLSLTTNALEIWKELIPPDPAGVSSIFNVVMTLDTRYYAYSYRRVLSDLYVVSNLR